MKEFIKKIANVQQRLKAPKTQYNSFGKYKYRNCEDILEGVKPHLGEMILTVSDEIVMVGDRIYIKSTATITDGEHSISNSALARESLNKKGMDESQITGTASSYARKYALNGLLLIDDTKDADNQFEESQPSKQYKKPVDHRMIISNYLELDPEGKKKMWHGLDASQKTAVKAAMA